MFTHSWLEKKKGLSQQRLSCGVLWHLRTIPFSISLSHSIHCSDNSSSNFPFSSALIVNDWGFNDYIWRCHKLIPASLAKSCSPPDYAKQAYILSL